MRSLNCILALGVWVCAGCGRRRTCRGRSLPLCRSVRRRLSWLVCPGPALRLWGWRTRTPERTWRAALMSVRALARCRVEEALGEGRGRGKGAGRAGRNAGERQGLRREGRGQGRGAGIGIGG